MLAKRLFDFVASLLGLVVLSPLFLILGLAIRLESPGPAFFRQERVGLEGKRFRIFKFRTMRQTAPREGPEITVGRDRRITAFGQQLRRTKLDELPQLINVLRGEMSLVGPRPEVPHYMDMYPPEQRRIILSVRPGITDFAAIEFSQESDILAGAENPEEAYVEQIMPRKFELYRRYVDERSFWVDMSLILRTLVKIVRR